MRRTVGTVLLALALALAAGCGRAHGPGIATASGGPGASAAPSASVDPEEAQRQFVRCMREHGVDVPEPDSDGSGNGTRIQVHASAGSNVDAAMAACHKYLPAGDLKTPDAATLEQMRQFTKCMRDHGVDVPDPDPNGGVTVLKKGTGSGGGPGVSPDDPAFKAAMTACQDKMPGKLQVNGGHDGDNPGTSTGGGK
jgi:hypothetical protein